MDKISSGSSAIDKLLDGGIEKDVVTTIFGPAGSGKSTACLLAAVSVAKTHKVIYIDTEGGHSATRLKQIAGTDEKLLERIMFLRPTNFAAQMEMISKLHAIVNPKVGLVVVDTITNLYRNQRSNDNAELNRELGRQIAQLVEIVRAKSIPVLMTNQVYSGMDEQRSIRMVGGDIIKYNSKCLIELKQLHSNKRSAILQRHRDIPQREILFEIVNEGFSEVKEKGFGIFLYPFFMQ